MYTSSLLNKQFEQSQHKVHGDNQNIEGEFMQKRSNSKHQDSARYSQPLPQPAPFASRTKTQHLGAHQISSPFQSQMNGNAADTSPGALPNYQFGGIIINNNITVHGSTYADQNLSERQSQTGSGLFPPRALEEKTKQATENGFDFWDTGMDVTGSTQNSFANFDTVENSFHDSILELNPIEKKSDVQKTRSFLENPQSQYSIAGESSRSHSKTSLLAKRSRSRSQSQDHSGAICEVEPHCREVSINFCSNSDYRGCSLAYCKLHAGSSKKRDSFCGCLDRDPYADICSECAKDANQAKTRFYKACSLFTFAIFLLLLFGSRFILLKVLGRGNASLSTTDGSLTETQSVALSHSDAPQSTSNSMLLPTIDTVDEDGDVEMTEEW